MNRFNIKSAEVHNVEAHNQETPATELPSRRALKDKEASKYIGMSESWLRHGRIEGSRLDHIPRPPFIKIGRSVRYLIEDLDAWLEQFQKLHHLAQLTGGTFSKDKI